MALTLKNIFTSGSDQISQNYTIESWHVSQSIDAFTAAQAYDINLSGSSTVTGSFKVTGSMNQTGNQIIIGSVTASAGFQGTSSYAATSSQAVTASYAVSSSYSVTSSYVSSSAYAVTASYANNGFSNFAYGSFSHTGSQAITSITAAHQQYLSTVEEASGVILVPNLISPFSQSRIQVANAGVYDTQFSTQVILTGGGAQTVSMWLRVNGVDLPRSTGTIELSGGASDTVASWNYVLTLVPADYIEFMWSATSTSVELFADTGLISPTRPDIPSVIVTIVQVK